MDESIEYEQRHLEGGCEIEWDACGEDFPEGGSGPKRGSVPGCDSGGDTALRAMSRKELGRQGELATVRFLRRHGFEILETNWECFAGEADIIAMDGDVLCFIEVKTRTSVAAGLPSEAVDERKRGRYERIAACYLRDFDRYDIRVRFDVAALLVLSDHHAFMRYHVNAFGVG